MRFTYELQRVQGELDTAQKATHAHDKECVLLCAYSLLSPTGKHACITLVFGCTLDKTKATLLSCHLSESMSATCKILSSLPVYKATVHFL